MSTRSSIEMTDVFYFNHLVCLNAVPFLQSTASYISYRNMCVVKDRVIIKTVFVHNLEIPWHVLTATIRWFESLWKYGCYASSHYTRRFICTIHLWATVCTLLSLVIIKLCWSVRANHAAAVNLYLKTRMHVCNSIPLPISPSFRPCWWLIGQPY